MQPCLSTPSQNVLSTGSKKSTRYLLVENLDVAKLLEVHQDVSHAIWSRLKAYGTVVQLVVFEQQVRIGARCGGSRSGKADAGVHMSA